MKIIQRILNFCAVILLFALPGKSFALNMQCASVGAAGDVTITWETSGTSNVNFRSWHLYYSSTIGGPFTLIDSSNTYNPSTINDPAANASVTPAYYYVVFTTNDGSPDILSDTIRAIGFILNNPGGTANLIWSPTRTPLIATNNPYYLIYREYPTGVFTLIDSVDARTSAIPMTYVDPITICDDTVKYRIDVRDSSGCISSSFVKGDRFFDTQPPARPVIDSVSVDNLGSATITWQVSTSTDTRTYIILQISGTTVIPIDTVSGHNTITFNTGFSAQNNPLTYQVIAVDSCNNPSAPSDPHTTIFLTRSFDICTHSTLLDWTPYDFWGTPTSYDVFVSVNGSADILLGNTTQTYFNDTSLVSGTTFCYRVRAIETGSTRSSTSNQVCFMPLYPPPPAFSYIRSVTVAGSNEVDITASVDPGPTVIGYRLYRSSSSLGPFTLIASQNISGVSSLFFTDNIATDQGPFYYYLSTIDSCGMVAITSQVSNTNLLTGVANSDLTNVITWTGYADWPTGVDHYNIYYSHDGVIDTLPFATVPGTSFNFIDSVFNDFYSGGEFCYVIEAVEAPGNPNLFTDTVMSNEICVEQQPIIYIPNAFHPGGAFNSIFMPSNGFVSATDYTFDIYNRWGENIFHTNDPMAGWDGSVKGHQAQEGIYIYRLVAKDGSGGDITKVGSVTLIR